MIGPEEILTRLLLGAFLGGIIGFEREMHGRAAGFRTNLLVCVASVLIMIVSEYYHFLTTLTGDYMRINPSTLAAGAITGMGFLGAGVIIKSGSTVQGLTTAACIWIVSAMGLAVGSGFYFPAVVTCIITFIALLLLRAVENKIPKIITRHVEVIGSLNLTEEKILTLLDKFRFDIRSMDYEKNVVRHEAAYSLTVVFRKDVSLQKLIDEISNLEAVKKVSIKKLIF